MRRKTIQLILIGLLLSLGIVIGACKGAVTRSQSQVTGEHTPVETAAQLSKQGTSSISEQTTQGPYPLATSISMITDTGEPYPQPPVQTSTLKSGSTPYPAPVLTKTQPLAQSTLKNQTPATITPTRTSTAPVFTPSPSNTSNPFPSASSTSPYPGPQQTPTNPSYPGPVTPTHLASNTPSRSVTASATSRSTLLPSPTSSPGSGTPEFTPTELPPGPPLEPPPAGSSVTIWHSWGPAEAETLQSIIDSFTRLYPDVTFGLLYIPLNELFSSYYKAAYFGQGPSLLLGPAKWGSMLFKEVMIADLDAYVPPNYLEDINQAALSSGKHKNALISLPLSLHGLVMFRNTSIISDPPPDFDELITSAQQATQGGIVGSYLDRGSFFSAPNIIGLGGVLMNLDEYPEFNDSFGLEWLDLLADYDVAGAVTFNTDRDLEMFKRGRVGIIVDGTWNISTLAQAISPENLAIDPWPAYGTGHTSGWVDADSVFLNSNLRDDDLFAALSFIGYLLDPNVQMHLAEVGHIPSVLTTQPRDPLIRQAMVAFSDGVPYPNTIDDYILRMYWSELDMVIRRVFEQGINPSTALEEANNNIIQILRDMRTAP